MGKITLEIAIRVVEVIVKILSVLNDALKGDMKDDGTRGGSKEK